MAFLKDRIKEQKFLEMEVDFNKFVEDNGITDDTIIYEMIFDREVFKEEKEVREYLKDKGYYDPAISENSDEFTAVLLSPSQVDPQTNIEIVLRRGVTVKAADLIPLMVMDEIAFNDKGEINLSSKFGELKLNEGMPYIIEVARVAEGEHPAYGKLKITQEHLESMESNFTSRVTGVDLAINEDHKKNEAFGWFKDVFLSQDKQVLYAQVTWNTKGYQALSEKEYRYFSPEFRFNYVHPHSGSEHGPTLLGGALTNYPFLKMEAITELNNKNIQGENLVEKTIELSVHNEKVVELSAKVNEVQLKLDTAESKNVELNNKIEKLEKDIADDKKKAVHEKLFNENKITKAQLVALNEGKGMLEVLSLNEKMNVEAAGSETKEEKSFSLSASDKAICTSLGLTDKEYVEFNK